MLEVEEETLSNVRFDSSWHNIWDKAKGDIHRSLQSDSSAVQLLKTIELFDCDGICMTLAAPTRFVRDWVRAHLQERILKKIQCLASNEKLLEIEVIVSEQARTVQPPSVVNPVSKVVKIPSDAFAQPIKNSLPIEPELSASYLVDKDDDRLLSSSLPKTNHVSPGLQPVAQKLPSSDDRYNFNNFVVGPSNEMAFKSAMKIASGECINFNPLFLYADVGQGKTHLMHAMVEHVQNTMSEQMNIIYLPAEQFMYRFVHSLRQQDIQQFKDTFRNLDLLLIDDLQFISGKQGTQEEFFYTLDTLIKNKKQVVIAADRCPNAIDNLEERIRSRLSGGLVVNIHPSDYALRVSIIESKINLLQQHYKGFYVPQDVIEFVASHVTRNIRELEGTINRLVAYATFTHSPITIDTVHQVVGDLLHTPQFLPNCRRIQEVVAQYYNISIEDMLSSRRHKTIVRPRQMAIYLAKKITGLSLPDIGRQFGGRDHSTIIHAIRRLEDIILQDQQSADEYKILQRLVRE